MNELTKQMVRDGKKGIPGTGQKLGGLEHRKSDWFEYMCQSFMNLIHVRFSPLNSPLAAMTRSRSWPAKLNHLLPLSKGSSLQSQ